MYTYIKKKCNIEIFTVTLSVLTVSRKLHAT